MLGYNTQHVIFIWGTFMSQSQTQWEVDTFADTKISVPKLYKVILHNDDETSFIFVVLFRMQKYCEPIYVRVLDNPRPVQIPLLSNVPIPLPRTPTQCDKRCLDWKNLETIPHTASIEGRESLNAYQATDRRITGPP